MYLYQKTEPNLWTVGCFVPALGRTAVGQMRWLSESDHESREEAANRVHFLNGGDQVFNMPSPEEVQAAVDRIREKMGDVLLDPTSMAEVDMAWPEGSFTLQMILAQFPDLMFRFVAAEGPGGGWPTVQVYGSEEAVQAFLAQGDYPDTEVIELL